MYNITYECRYHRNDVFLETDDVTDDEKDYIKNVLYQEDLMNIFNLEQYDDYKNFYNEDILKDTMSELYEKLKENEVLLDCMKQLANALFSENPEIGLCLLYSYDFMYVTHKCVVEYLDNGLISDENINLLKTLVNNYVNN